MATNLKNLSDYDIKTIPSAKDMSFAIVTAEWNEDVTKSLQKGAFETLLKHGAKEKNILKKFVPGTVELTLGAQFMLENTDVDAVLILGCVIQGETPHFDYVCQSVTHGMTELNMEYNTPVIFGVLTTSNIQQAKDRSGGKHGNKGTEAAITAIKMVALKKEMQELD
ncbi:MAG: 6,7-dimethyl-8-ribityllumazine synthase [Bacteroidales bacterium]|jgi:6,7-dimethyl-8-ribityllumazine synthase|nr:6,7-dimethyl-8-ribityllumazine synthase [Bacteroidales bacterium]